MAICDTTELQRSNRRFMKRSFESPLLTREKEAELSRRWTDFRDEDAMHQMVSSHLRLVTSMAVRFRGFGLPLNDLVQEGVIGLIEAAGRFDPDRGARLSTYASWWIRAAMQDYILRNWSMVRLGTTAAQRKLFFNLRRLRAKIAPTSVDQMRPEERGEIAEELMVPVAAVEAMEGRLSGVDQSLNATTGEDTDQECLDLLEDAGPTPEEIVMARRDTEKRRAWLQAALGELPSREQMIIRARHLNDTTVTLADLGRTLGVSKERVRQLERRALDRLQQGLSEIKPVARPDV